MENKSIARSFKLLSQLMELHGENSFKVKSIASAAFNIDKNPVRLADKSLSDLESINGIGKSAAAKIFSLTQTGTMPELEELIQKTPAGILEIMTVKGLGPKKVLSLWKELGIESLGELLYACNENRLIEAKGFGIKTQEEIRKAIEFKIAGRGFFLYSQLELPAQETIAILQNAYPDELVSLCGAIRRKCEILDGIDMLVSGDDILADIAQTLSSPIVGEYTIENKKLSLTLNAGVVLRIHESPKADFYTKLFSLTGNDEHVSQVKDLLDGVLPQVSSEEELYERAGLPYISPELREGGKEITLAQSNSLPVLIEASDLKGSLHNHSNWSDGINTLLEMAQYCKDTLHLEYLGICDHSRTAVYARGLTEERVLAQHQEIDELNRQLAPFKIFKGIESDILPDGSLDYAPELLATFDFVVASVHSAFRMSEEKATERLITAIENPFTTILGHPTGRLLLSRSGYPIDHKRIIDACAANNVVIEINANPLRLDLDWRWHQYAIEKGVMLSVNPDAHSTKGFHDTHFGLLVARKGGLTAKDCLNAMSLAEISEYFSRRKQS